MNRVGYIWAVIIIKIRNYCIFDSGSRHHATFVKLGSYLFKWGNYHYKVRAFGLSSTCSLMDAQNFYESTQI